MALFKATFQFHGGGSVPISFSEVYYRDSASIGAAASLDKQAIYNRCSCLDPTYVLDKIRWSDVLNPRVTTIVQVGQSGFAQNAVGPAPPQVAAVITLASIFIPARRKLWMRGLNSGMIAWEPIQSRWKLTPSGGVVIQNWINTLNADDFVIPKRHPATEAGYGDHVVLALVPVIGAALTTVTTQDNHGLSKGGNVILHKFNAKDVPGINGIFQVVNVVDVTHFQIAYAMPRLEAIQTSTGVARAYGIIDGALIDPTISKFAYVGIRKSRSPFTGGRGSRRSPIRGLRLSP